jgi:hypothetical protein
LFRNTSEHALIIGSSNCTNKGLCSQGEHNLEITGNAHLFNQHRKIIESRIDPKQEAINKIAEYAAAYKKYRKFRNARKRVARIGSRKWKPITKRSTANLDGQSFPYLITDHYERDLVLIGNVEKEKKNMEKADVVLPGRWINCGTKKDATSYDANRVFVLCDVKAKTIGFAVCHEKIFAKDGGGRERPIIFYRFIRNWKRKVKKEDRFNKLLSRLHVTTEREKNVGQIFKERFAKLMK